MNKKLIIGIIVTIVLAIGIGATVYLTQQQQDNRQRADERDQSPFGKAIVFNGVDSSVTIPAENVPITASPFTVEFWIKPEFDVANPTRQYAILESDQMTTNPTECHGRFGFYIEPNGATEGNTGQEYALRVALLPDSNNSNGSQAFDTFNYKLPFNQWTHVALVVESDTSAVLYYNGGKVGTLTLPEPQCHYANLSIGKSSSNAPYKGQLDELRFSNNARYTDNFVLPTAPLQLDANTTGLWRFDSNVRDEVTGIENFPSTNLSYTDSTLGGGALPPACQADLATCEWDTANGATSYTYKIVNTATNEVVAEGDIAAPATSISFSSEPNNTYSCTVTPVNGCGTGDSDSAQTTCTVATPTPTNTPTPTPTDVVTPTPTNTPTPSPTKIPTPTATNTPTPTKTVTIINTPTPTTPPIATNTPTSIPTATATPIPGVTYTPTPTMEAPGSALQTFTLIGGIFLTLLGGLVLFIL